MSSIRSFIPLEKLGQGTYSNVYKVRRVDDNQIYALKKVKLNSLTLKQKQNALNQVRILASIESPYIVAYKQAFFDQSLNVLCIVMEYADDGDLQKYIKIHTKSFKLIQQEQIWRAAQQILKGLQTLHSRGILHRDIKCANIFKSKQIYKLGDLNVSKVNGDKLAYTQTGTPYYASPEVWRDQPYDSKSDIWSFGCIIYEMAALKPPFNGKDLEDLFKTVQKGKITPLTAHYSVQLWNFIQLCLQKDSKKRPSATQLISHIKKHNPNQTSGLRINNPQSKKLLKTIKLPNDLKKLNQALPTSKYRKNNYVSESQKKQQTEDKLVQKSKIELKNSEQLKQNIQAPQTIKGNSILLQKKSLQKKFQTDKNTESTRMNSNINKSAIIISVSSQKQLGQNNKNMQQMADSCFKSPKHRPDINRLIKSPASEIRLGKKVQNSLGYSERLQKSQRKPSTASKVQKIKHQIDFDTNMKDLVQKLNKPIISIPRTQKKPTLINNSHLIQNSYHYPSATKQNHVERNISQIVSSSNVGKYSSAHGQAIHNIMQNQYASKNQALDSWKNKLLKKNRILSTNNPKPSWW